MHMRPKSAKPGARVSDYDEDSQDSRSEEHQREQIKTESQKNKNRMLSAAQQRKFLNIAKPIELSNGEFTRIMPRNIYQDKERLYSEALQLRQNMHGIIDENMKLKTKIAVLEKEKDKLSRMCDQDMGMKSYNTNNLSHQNNMVSKLKKMLRDSQQDVRLLEAELRKLKKSVKYTKISELEIENKTLIQESARLNKIIEELMINQEEEAQQQNRLEELEAFLKSKLEQNQSLMSTNKRISDQIINLEEALKANQVRTAEREKKLLKDLQIAKRRLADSKRQSEYLTSQITKLREEKNKPAPQPTINRNKVAAPKPDSKLLEEIESLKKRNAELEQKLSRQSNPIQNKQPQAPAPAPKTDTNTKIAANNSAGTATGVPLIIELKKNSSVQEPQLNANKQADNRPPISPPKDELVNEVSKEQPLKETQKEQHQKESPKQKGKDESYGSEQFEEDKQQYQNQNRAVTTQKSEQEPAAPKSPEKKSEAQQSGVNFEQYIGDFAAEDEKNDEEIIYKKSEKKTSSSKKKKAGKTKTGSNKKKQLTQISALLTTRMKAQRYPFAELKSDIIDSKETSFRLNDMQSMLRNSPFFLNDHQTTTVLQYLFEDQVSEAESVIPIEKLIEKLRKLIKEFDLLEEEEQEQMDLRIVDMVSTYANELQAAFEQKRNGPNTISKAGLEELFNQLQLQPAYIDLIIGRLALQSEDLEHLNYIEFFREFYQGDEEEMREVAEEQELSNSRTLNRQHMIKEEQVEESEESRRSKRRSDEGKKKPRKAAYDLE